MVALAASRRSLLRSGEGIAAARRGPAARYARCGPATLHAAPPPAAYAQPAGRGGQARRSAVQALDLDIVAESQ